MLSNFQKKTAAIALTCLSTCVIISFIVLVIYLFGAFLDKFSLVVWPLATAAILSIIIKPIIDFLSTKLKMGRVAACSLTFALIVGIFSLVLIFVVPKAVNQTVELVQALPEASNKIAAHLSAEYPMLKDKIESIRTSISEAGFSQETSAAAVKVLKNSLSTIWSAAGFVLSLAGTVAAFAVVPIYLFYMLTAQRSEGEGSLSRNLSFLNKNLRDDIVFLVSQFAQIMTSFFRGQLVIAFLLGLILGAGFGFAGIKFGFLLGFIIGLINIVPYLGTILGLSTILPLAYFQDGGGIILSAAALIIFCVAQLIEAYILTPKIMGDRTGLHPMTIIFSVFFWGTALGGLLGMILAIPLTAFVVVFWKLLKQKYLTKLFEQGA